MPKVASRLVNISIRNIAAVGAPANKRRWLVVKAAGPKIENVSKDEAMTFDDAMICRRLYKVYEALGERYGALMETIDSIRISNEPNKAAAIKAALTGFMDSMKAAMPVMLADMDTDDGDTQKAGRKISGGRLAKLKTLHKVLSEIISEGEADMEKKTPDASYTRRLAQMKSE